MLINRLAKYLNSKYGKDLLEVSKYIFRPISDDILSPDLLQNLKRMVLKLVNIHILNIFTIYNAFMI